jgi:hypothetical protein
MFAVPGSFSPSTRGQAGAFLFLLVIGIGTAIFFWTSLRSFKPELRAAYLYFCIGALLVGITQIQLPIVALFNFDYVNTPLVRYGGFMTPYTIVTCCLYLGIRKYAQIIGIRSKAMSLPLIAPGFILTGIIMALVPNDHTFKPGHEFFFDLTVVSLSLQAYIGVFALWIAYHVIGSTTHLYATATKLLALTFALCLIGTIEYVTSVFVFGELYGTRELVAAIPFILTAISLMYAAYAFKKSSRH